MHREALKKTRKILTLMRKSFSLSHKICINLRELSPICENDQSFMFDDFEKLLNILLKDSPFAAFIHK